MKNLERLIERYPVLAECKNDVKKAIEVMIASYENGGKVLLCGNGGSCADCDHIVGELMKGFLKKRPMNDERKRAMLDACKELDEELLSKLQCGLPAISLPSITALGSAFNNDVDPELTYAQAAFALGKSKFTAALDNDLNTSLAVTALYDVFKLDTNDKTKLALIEDFEKVLGLGLISAAEKLLCSEKKKQVASGVDEELLNYINEKIAERAAAKKSRDFALADSIRAELSARGITLVDSREGTTFKLD